MIARLALALCLVLAACDRTAQPAKPTPQYQILGDGRGGAWRMDTTTGEMKHCYAPIADPPHCDRVVQS